MKIQDYEKKAQMYNWTEKYLYSQFGPCLALWFAFIGCRDAQSKEQPFWSTVPLCCTKALFDFCLFPAVSAIQKQTLRKNLSKAVKHSKSLWRSSALPGVAWSGKVVS